MACEHVMLNCGKCTRERDALRAECDSLRTRQAELEKERDHWKQQAKVMAGAADVEKADRIQFRTDRDSLAARLAEVERERDDEHRLNAKLLIDRHEDGQTIGRIEHERDLAIAECQRMRAVYEPALASATDALAQRDIARASEERMRAVLPRVFDAGYEYARENADVSEHNGWHRCDPFVEWPTDEKVTAARQQAIDTALTGETP